MATKLVSTGVQFPSGNIQTTAAAGSTHTLVANGSVGNGKVVAIRSDGKVEQVSGVDQTVDHGDETQLSQTNSQLYRGESATVWHDNASKLVHIYRDTGNSQYPTARVGTVASDNSVSWGTAVVVSSTGISGNNTTGAMLAIEYDPSAQKVFIMFMNSVTPTGVVGTVSGTSISFGTSTTISASGLGTAGLDIAYNSTANKHVVVALGHSSYQAGVKVVAATISGTGCSFGTAIALASPGTYSYSTTVASSDTENRVFVGHQSRWQVIKIWALTISGTTLASGPVFQPPYKSNNSVMLFDKTIKKPVLIFRRHETDTDSLGCLVFDITIANSLPNYSVLKYHQLEYQSISYFDAEWDDNLKMICVFGRDRNSYHIMYFWNWRLDSNGYGVKNYSKQAVATTSTSNNGTNAQHKTMAIINTNPSRVFIYYAKGYYAYHQIFQITADYSANAPDFVGIAQNSASNGGNVTFTLLYGANEEQSSLTVGSDYYITYNGSLSSTPTDNSKIGKAIATDTILVGGW